MALVRFSKTACIAGAIIASVALVACGPIGPNLSAEERRLRTDLQSDFTPEWSPDGKIVVAYGGRHLYAAAADGSDLWRITRRGSGWYTQAAFSPDGLLAFPNSYRDWKSRLLWIFGEPKYSIKIADFDGRRARVRHTTPATESMIPKSLAWSPDGSFLLYRQLDQTTILDGKGTEVRRYFHAAPEEWPNTFGSPPVWSNHSQRTTKIIASSYEGGQVVISTDRPDSPEPLISRRISGFFSEISTPSWGLDDQRVYFVARKASENDAVLYSADPDGTNLQTLATLSGSYYVEVKLSPTGEQLLLNSRWTKRPNPWREPLPHGVQKTGTGLWVANVDGSNLRHIQEGYLYAEWSSDGKQIAVFDLDTTGQRRHSLYITYLDGRPPLTLFERKADG